MSIEWQDEGVVLSIRPLGENKAVAILLTQEHGRHAGVVHGARSKKNRADFMTGNRLQIRWQARLDEQLGVFAHHDPLCPYAARVLDDALRLAALASACAVCDAAVPERQPHAAAYRGLVAFLDSLASEAWPSVYVHWELALLRDLGFGLDLASCAASGVTTDLAYVSPKSGRAVSRTAGADWQDKLLGLPAFLVDGGEGDAPAVGLGLTLTAFFLDRHVLAPHRRPLPPARLRLAEMIRRRSTD